LMILDENGKNKSVASSNIILTYFVVIFRKMYVILEKL